MAIYVSPRARKHRARKFAAEYVGNGFKKADAVLACGFTNNRQSAYVIGFRLLQNDITIRAVEEHLAKSKMSADEVLEALTEVAQTETKISGSDKLKALELLGKGHKLFTDRLETEDKTKSPAQALQQMLKEIGQEISLDQAEKIMAASVQRARIKAVS